MANPRFLPSSSGKLGRHPSSVRTPILLVLFTLAVLLYLLANLVVPSTFPTAPHYSRTRKPLSTCARSGSRAKTFLIVFQSRSGSTAISGELKAHPQTHMGLLEYLDRKGVGITNTSGALDETRLFFREGIAKGLSPGFKIRSYHIMPQPEKWAELAREFDTRIIWQYRKNLFKSAVGTYQSEILGDMTSVSGIKVKEAVGDRCAMGVGCQFNIQNMEAFHNILKKRVLFQSAITRAVDILDDGRDCVMELPYEDYLYYPRETMHDLQRFLGLKHENTAPDRIKATRDSLCDVVANYDELCYSFYGCAVWQPYLEDFVNNCRCSNFSRGTDKFCLAA